MLTQCECVYAFVQYIYLNQQGCFLHSQCPWKGEAGRHNLYLKVSRLYLKDFFF